MICKKCGREYEDDMPKCLWCDAPNESLSSQDECETSSADSEAQEEAYRESLNKLVDPELERAFDDNVRRGKSAISWTKFQIVLNILIVFFMASAIPFCVFIGKNWLWVYHAHKEQSKFTETFFAPWGAVICYFIPVVNYFVFKALLENQGNTLKLLGIKVKTESNKLLTWFFIFNIATPIFNYLNYKSFNTPVIFISTLLWIILTVLGIKLIKAATANEQAVHDQLENNRINKKVEEIIAQREAV